MCEETSTKTITDCEAILKIYATATLRIQITTILIKDQWPLIMGRGIQHLMKSQ